MPFPASDRVFYGKNPLVEVVCQLRFPSILRIESHLPSEFQDRIRRAFPVYNGPTTLPRVEGAAALPPQLLKLIAGAATSVSHEFLSADQVWKVSLTRDFIALTTTTYVNWQDFAERLAPPLEAFTEIYEPAFYQRIGLRYVDRIVPASLGLAGRQWRELLKPHIAGELADPTVGPHVERALRELLIALPTDGGKVRIVHGIEDNGAAYVIDSDFFTEQQIAVRDVSRVLVGFNQLAGRLFRWCIEDPLHIAMEPRNA